MSYVANNSLARYLVVWIAQTLKGIGLCVCFTEGRDYFLPRSDCRILFFEKTQGRQTLCSFIEILDDDVIEPEEYFTVQLYSPVATFVDIGEARVSIIDNDSCDIDSQQHISSALPTTPPRGTCYNVHVAT